MVALWWFYTIVLGAAFAQIAMGMAAKAAIESGCASASGSTRSRVEEDVITRPATPDA